MTNPTAFLSTLAESAAAIVAIVGGFLVSRLVALSSEREGLRRQLRHAEDQLQHETALHAQAHAARLAISTRDFTEWTLREVIPSSPEDVDREALLEKLPRASSREEMEPLLDALLQRVADAKTQIGRHVYDGDTNDIDLGTLRERGLVVAGDDEDLYQQILDEVRQAFPRPQSAWNTLSVPPLRGIVSPVWLATDAERLDAAIHEEQEHLARKHGLEAEVARLNSEIELVGSPVGVTPAIVILALYSAVGIGLPVVVMTANPGTLSDWKAWGLVVLFVAGLSAVLGYMFWYAKSLER